MNNNTSEDYLQKKSREYDWETVEPTVAILELIAKIEHDENVETAALLEPPLNTYVDTDALSTLVQCEGLVSITLKISRYHVQIHGNTVEVTAAKD